MLNDIKSGKYFIDKRTGNCIRIIQSNDLGSHCCVEFLQVSRSCIYNKGDIEWTAKTIINRDYTIISKAEYILYGESK